MEQRKILEQRNERFFSKMRGLSKREIKRRVKICTDTEIELIGILQRMGGDFRRSFEDFLINYGDFSDNLNVIYNRVSASALTSNTPFAREFDLKERKIFNKLLPVTERRLRKYVKENGALEAAALSAWLFSPARAERISRGVVNSLCGCEAFEEMKRRGYRYKDWNTVMDGRERATHAVMNGRRVPIDEPFVVGGYRMMFPGDVTYDPPLKEVIDCRCTITPR